VVAEVGLAAGEPLPERWPVVVEDPLGRRVPVDRLRLFRPEALGVLDGAAVEVFVAHGCLESVGSPEASPVAVGLRYDLCRSPTGSRGRRTENAGQCPAFPRSCPRTGQPSRWATPLRSSSSSARVLSM